MQQSYTPAIQELQAQRDFLLRNVWRVGDPREQAEEQAQEQLVDRLGMADFYKHLQDAVAVGCLVERAVCTLATQVRNILMNASKDEVFEMFDSGDIFFDVSTQQGVQDPVAINALLWAIAEQSDEDENFMHDPTPPRYFPGDDTANRQDYRRTRCMEINDNVFSAGDAVATLDRAIDVLRSLNV